MKRQSKVLLAGILALGAFACFNDPTSDLRNGPAQLRLSRSAATILNGDSIAVTGTLVDAQGNSLPTDGATWTTDAAGATLVRVTVDTVAPAPGAIFTRAFITGISNQPGVATVTATAGGQTASFHVTVLPSSFPGTAAVTGTAGADTIVINNPAPAPPTVVVYTAGDTLVLTAPANITFANNATVTFGTIPAMLLSNSGTIIKALARAPYAGRVTIANLVYAGDAVTGPVAIATIRTDSLNIQHARWRGTQAVTADPNFGAGTLLTVTAPAGVTFDATTQIAIGGTPVIGATAAVPPVSLIRLSQTATTMTAISPSNQAAALLITGALVGTTRVDSLRVGTAPVTTTIAKSSFPGTVAQTGAGNLLDTITINGGAVATFTTAAASRSTVTIGSVNGFPQLAHIISVTASTIKAVAKVPNNAPISVSNVIIAGTTIPSLTTSGNVVVLATTGEPGEPANSAVASATPLPAFTGATDTIYDYRSVDCEDDGTLCPGNGDSVDWLSFVVPAGNTQKIRVIIDWFGDGTAGNSRGGYGSEPQNPDLDLRVCATTACTSGTSQRVGDSAGLTNPETVSSAAALAPGTYFMRVSGFVTATPITYRVRIVRF